MGDEGSNLEIEIKLRVRDAAEGLERIRRAGCRLSRGRTFETNILFDTPDDSLRRRDEILRLREFGREHVLTFKGKGAAGRHKVREELEVTVSDSSKVAEILHRLGLSPSFRYEKYRTEFRPAEGPGHALLDETPIGVYLELEGPPEWIDSTAAAMGFRLDDYVTVSYGALYVQHCLQAGILPSDMIFPQECGKGA